MQRFYALSSYFRQRFGERIQKIPLDAGFSCPNRDGAISSGGCAFCNPRGSGSGLLSQGLSLTQQWEHWRTRFARRYKARLFMAYLQSFSNTYGPTERLREVLDEISALPQIAGLSLGTRPDCLDDAKIALLASQPVDEIWLELGLQSASDETLARINRGHGFDVFARWTEKAAASGLKVCAHVIFGLPGETGDDFLHTIEAVNSLPVRGVKLHNLYVCRDTRIADEWQRGEYVPPSREEYVRTLGRALARLRPDLVVQRLTGDAAPGELLAPDWAADKSELLNALAAHFESNDIWQGKENGAESAPPVWLDPNAELPEALR